MKNVLIVVGAVSTILGAAFVSGIIAHEGVPVQTHGAFIGAMLMVAAGMVVAALGVLPTNK